MVLIYNKPLILRYLCTTKILFQSIQISQHTNKKRDIDLISFEHKVQTFEWVVDLDSIKAVYWMSDGSTKSWRMQIHFNSIAVNVKASRKVSFIHTIYKGLCSCLPIRSLDRFEDFVAWF
jgi:hypothetical protein